MDCYTVDGTRYVCVLNRLGIECLEPSDEFIDTFNNTIVISITGCNSPDANLKVQFKDVLFLKFDDIEKSTKGWLRKYKPISQEQADQIIDFVLNNDARFIFCHCDAGISRSPAVAAAIMKALGGDDRLIFDSNKYVINQYVHQEVLMAFERAGLLETVDAG